MITFLHQHSSAQVAESPPSYGRAFFQSFVAALFAGLVATPVFGQQASTAKSNTPSTPSNSNTSSAQSNWPNNTPAGHNANGDLPDMVNPANYDSMPIKPSLHETEASFGPITFGPYFLSPPPPFMGELPNQKEESSPPPYPAALANHVGEIYYMALSNLIGRQKLSDQRLQRINAYLNARQSATQSLRKQVSQAQSLNPDETGEMLAAMGEQQTPLLLAQEMEAEAIRRDLTQDSPVRITSDAITTLVPIGDKDPEKNRLLMARFVSLKAAQFQPGLSLDQRLLLQEYVSETQTTDRTESEKAYVSFWPASARIHMPMTVPPALKARLDEFLNLKTRLKQELIAAVQRDQNVVFVSSRTKAYEQLAQMQQEGFQNLDRLAEAIRRDLALLPNPDEPPASTLPPDLTSRLQNASEHKAVLWRELLSTVNEFRLELPTDNVELVSQNEKVSMVVTPKKSKEDRPRPNQDARSSCFVFLSDTEPKPLPDREAVVARLNTYNDNLPQRFTALATEFQALRAEISRYQAALPQARTNANVDELVAHFVKSYKAQELWNRYSDYRTAVLLPGLSPAQRRLLFNAVQVDLFKERHSINP